jgi:hypothetical protein
MTRPIRMLIALGVIALAALVIGLSRTGEDAKAPPPAADSMLPSGKIGGEGITIEEAMRSESPEPLLVRGYLFRTGDILVLCSGLDANGCAAPFLTVDGEPGIEPSSEQTMLLGKVEDGVLHAVNLSSS